MVHHAHSRTARAAPRSGGAPTEETGVRRTARPVVFFDGNCGLCRALVALVSRAKQGGRIRFEPLEGDVARRHLRPEQLAEQTLWLKHQARVHARSSAVLRLMWLLGWPWNLAAVLLLVPRPLRDWIYDAVARRRGSVCR